MIKTKFSDRKRIIWKNESGVTQHVLGIILHLDEPQNVWIDKIRSPQKLGDLICGASCGFFERDRQSDECNHRVRIHTRLEIPYGHTIELVLRALRKPPEQYRVCVEFDTLRA